VIYFSIQDTYARLDDASGRNVTPFYAILMNTGVPIFQPGNRAGLPIPLHRGRSCLRPFNGFAASAVQ